MHRATFVLPLLLAAAYAIPPGVQRLGPPAKVRQLTGDFDRPLGIATRSQTGLRAGVEATDLGSSFVHKGRLCFLFGDTWVRPGDLDAMAFADIGEPEELKLDFVVGPDGRFQPVAPPGVGHGAFCVPSGGISLGGAMYVVYTGSNRVGTMQRSVLARSPDDGATWETLGTVSADDPTTTAFTARFVNVSLAQGPGAGAVWIFGAGEYRRSDFFLARASAADFPDPRQWRYWAGNGGWSALESAAEPVVRHRQFGEFSVAWIAELGCWTMLYNSANPRGILLRTASRPEGPWSDAMVLLDPGADGAYGSYMHINHQVRVADQFHDPGRENVWGGEYGPYLIPSFTRRVGNGCDVYFTMSTWNPYQVVLMKVGLRAK